MLAKIWVSQINSQILENSKFMLEKLKVSAFLKFGTLLEEQIYLCQILFENYSFQGKKSSSKLNYQGEKYIFTFKLAVNENLTAEEIGQNYG